MTSHNQIQSKIQPIGSILGYHGIFITEVGYLTFHHVHKSDHILIWIKLSNSVAFVNNTPPLIYPSESKLILHHPREQIKYTPKLRHITQYCGLFPRIRKLERLHTLPPSAASIKYCE